MAGATIASPTSLTHSPHVQPQSDVELSPGKYHYCFNLTTLTLISVPVRKNFENVSVDSTDSITRSPHSMPVPSVPRRAGLPRKKPVKPPPEAPEERVEEAIAAPSVASTVDDHKTVETEEVILAPKDKEPDHKIIDDHRAEIHDEPRPIDLDVQPVEELIVESKATSSGESKEEPAHDVQSPPPDELKQEYKHEHEHERKHVGPDHPDQPDDVDAIRKDQAEDNEIMDYSDEHSDYDEILSVEHHEHQHLRQDDDHHIDAEPQPYSATDATGADEDAAEEEVRRKRVAERLAKMGGINPFAAPPLRPSSEETGHADSVVSSHASPESVPLPVSPSRPDVPTRRASLPSHEVAKPHPLAFEPKVEEEQGEKEVSDGK